MVDLKEKTPVSGYETCTDSKLVAVLQAADIKINERPENAWPITGQELRDMAREVVGGLNGYAIHKLYDNARKWRIIEMQKKEVERRPQYLADKDIFRAFIVYFYGEREKLTPQDLRNRLGDSPLVSLIHDRVKNPKSDAVSPQASNDHVSAEEHEIFIAPVASDVREDSPSDSQEFHRYEACEDPDLRSFMEQVEERLKVEMRWPIPLLDLERKMADIFQDLDGADRREAIGYVIGRAKSLTVVSLKKELISNINRTVVSENDARTIAALVWGYNNDITLKELDGKFDGSLDLLHIAAARSRRDVYIDYLGVRSELAKEKKDKLPKALTVNRYGVAGFTNEEMDILAGWDANGLKVLLERGGLSSIDSVSSTRIPPAVTNAAMRLMAYVRREKFDPAEDYESFVIARAVRVCLAAFEKNSNIKNMQELIIALSQLPSRR